MLEEKLNEMRRMLVQRGTLKFKVCCREPATRNPLSRWIRVANKARNSTLGALTSEASLRNERTWRGGASEQGSARSPGGRFIQRERRESYLISPWCTASRSPLTAGTLPPLKQKMHLDGLS